MTEDLDFILKNLGERFEIEKNKTRLKELEFEVSNPDLWTKNRFEAEKKTKEYGKLKNLVTDFESITNAEEARAFEAEYMPKNEYENLPALISVYPGAGGEDAADWGGMLMKMYGLYAARRGWKTRMIDDDTIEIKGEDAYNILKNESGVHRLVRISPYDSKGLRHTSFALVEVLPDLGKIKTDIEIPEKDIKVDFNRSSGPGGQNANKVETVVKVTHIPTGLTATSSVERGQSQNREIAMNILKARLLKLMKEKQETEISNLKTKVSIEWGHQIRSYVLHPYKMVKDHRTEYETSKVDDVLNGQLDELVEAELNL